MPIPDFGHHFNKESLRFRRLLTDRPIEIDIYQNSVPVNQTVLFWVANVHAFYVVYKFSGEDSSTCIPSCEGSFSMTGTAGTIGISRGYSPVVTNL